MVWRQKKVFLKWVLTVSTLQVLHLVQINLLKRFCAQDYFHIMLQYDSSFVCNLTAQWSCCVYLHTVLHINIFYFMINVWLWICTRLCLWLESFLCVHCVFYTAVTRSCQSGYAIVSSCSKWSIQILSVHRCASSYYIPFVNYIHVCCTA